MAHPRDILSPFQRSVTCPVKEGGFRESTIHHLVACFLSFDKKVVSLQIEITVMFLA